MSGKWEVSAMSRDMGLAGRLHVSELAFGWWAQVIVGNGRDGLDYVCESHPVGEEYPTMSDAMQACERWYATHVFVAFLARMGAGIETRDTCERARCSLQARAIQDAVGCSYGAALNALRNANGDVDGAVTALDAGKQAKTGSQIIDLFEALKRSLEKP